MWAAANGVEGGPPAWVEPEWWTGALGQATASMSAGVCVAMMLAGVAFLLWGFRLYRWLVVLAFVAIGIALGWWASQRFQFNESAGIIVGAIVLGVPAWPLYRIACGILGGTALAIILMAGAESLGLDSEAARIALTVVAFVAGAALTVLFLRPIIIIGTALDGAFLLIQGAIALTALWPALGGPVLLAVEDHLSILLASIVILAAVGAIIQFRDPRGKKKSSGSD